MISDPVYDYLDKNTVVAVLIWRKKTRYLLFFIISLGFVHHSLFLYLLPPEWPT
jgi:hypothetical protein